MIKATQCRAHSIGQRIAIKGHGPMTMKSEVGMLKSEEIWMKSILKTIIIEPIRNF
jgi:hypothetical protein